MPEVRAAERSPLLGGIAEALAKLRSGLNPAPDTPLHSLEWLRPGDWLFGKAPEEVENWAYGNPPFQMTPLGDRLPKPKTGRAESLADTAFLAADVLPIGALGRGIAAAPSLVAGGKAAQKGAIRIKGQPETVAAHSTSASPEALREIAENGLYAPSIGLNWNRPNDYNKTHPQYVFRAGALDRPFPDEAPPGIFNRDAFVWNPNKYGGPIINQWKHEVSILKPWEKRFSELSGDARLTQMLPDEGSHLAAILASPRFKSLEEWETSEFGADLLLGNPRQIEQNVLDYETRFMRILNEQHLPASQRKEMFAQIPGLVQGNVDARYLRGSPLGDLYEQARKAPSAMAEMKIYAPSVPAGPNQAVIYQPRGDDHRTATFKDLGYEVYNPRELFALAGKPLPSSTYDTSKHPMALLAPDTGLPPPPADEARRMADDLELKGYVPGGGPAQESVVKSPKGVKAPALPDTMSFDEALEMINKGGWSPGKPVPDFDETPDFAYELNEWMTGDTADEMSQFLQQQGISFADAVQAQAIFKASKTGKEGLAAAAEYLEMAHNAKKVVSPAKSSAAPSWHTPGNTYEEIESKYHDFIATAPAQTSTMQDFLNAQFGPKEADKVYDLYLNTPGNMLEAIKVYLNLPKASSP